MERIPTINGVKNPQTGHRDLNKNKKQINPFPVINGITLGQ
jgi:hypothetical protein